MLREIKKIIGQELGNVDEVLANTILDIAGEQDDYVLYSRVQGLEFEVNKKGIKNLHINILPPDGRYESQHRHVN